MPFLHWETDRGRAKAAEAIKRASGSDMHSLDTLIESMKNRQPFGSSGFQRSNSITRNNYFTSSHPSITGKNSQARSLLGRIFMLAAALKEAMDAFVDETLIEEYLDAKPGLHPRRTLDQSHYWMIDDTSSRDRDQVLYRHTAASTPPHLHKCSAMLYHIDNRNSCAHCSAFLGRIPRIVMVDQLWLWILDESKCKNLFLQERYP
jgi:hypothetical protein